MFNCIEQINPSASPTFTEGVLAEAIPWDLLSKQLVTRTEYGDQIQAWVRSEDNKFTPPADFNFTHWDEGDEADEAEGEDHPNSSPVWDSVGLASPVVRKGTILI